MNGYITEKLFDCLYAGTIPLYLGAPDISQYIPANVYIDCRRFSSWDEMWHYVRDLPPSEADAFRTAGRAFLQSEMGRRFYNGLDAVLGACC